MSANLRFRAALRGATMLGAGAYWQQGRGPKRLTRLELRVQMGDQGSTLTQVCDGLHLWTHRTLAGQATLTRIDLQRAAREAGAAGAAGPPQQPLALPAAGGLPQILMGLADQFEFEGLEQTSVQSIPMWVLSGTWNRTRLRELLPQQAAGLEQGRGADFTKLAPHVPDHVELVLGQDDLFPYRIEYSRGSTADGGRRTLLALEFFNVRIGDPVDPRQFTYRPPPDLEIVDVTDEFVRRGQPGQGRAGGK